MQSFILLIMCLCLFSYPAFAQSGNYLSSSESRQETDDDDYTPDYEGMYTDELSPSERVWQETVDQKVYENYGSTSSPAFSGRENINPNEDSYDFGGADGTE